MASLQVEEHLFRDLKYGCGFFKELESMYQADHLTDMTLCASDGVGFKVHSLVLSAASPYFKAHIIHDKNPEIKLLNVGCDLLLVLIKYCYSGEVQITRSNVRGLLQASDYLGLLSLRSGCVDFITRIMDVTTCTDFLVLAEKLSLEECVSDAISFIAQHFIQVMEVSYPNLMELAVKLIKKLLRSPHMELRNQDTSLVLAPHSI